MGKKGSEKKYVDTEYLQRPHLFPKLISLKYQRNNLGELLLTRIMEFFLNWARLHLALTLTGCNPIYNLYHRRHQFTSVHQFVPSGPVHPDTSIMTCGSLCYVEKISSGPDCDAFTVDPMSGECQIGRFDYGHDLQISDAELTPLWTEDQGNTVHFTILEPRDQEIHNFIEFRSCERVGWEVKNHFRTNVVRMPSSFRPLRDAFGVT